MYILSNYLVSDKNFLHAKSVVLMVENVVCVSIATPLAALEVLSAAYYVMNTHYPLEDGGRGDTRELYCIYLALSVCLCNVCLCNFPVLLSGCL